MKTEELRTRIEKKEQEIAKLERLYAKYSAEEDAQEREIIERFLQTGNRDEYRAFLKTQNRWYGGDAWNKANELYSAKETLAKYHKQLEAEVAKENTISELPAVIKEFGEELYNRWNEYDFWKQEQIRQEYRNATRENYKEFSRMMNEKWGRGWYDFAWQTSREQIEKANRNAVDALILNLVTRTVEIAGTITDAKYLRLDRDNNGYAIINGIVIGKKGKARVESIGAGGYNIQRYHIRVLVKEVRD